jgi:chromate transporter
MDDEEGLCTTAGAHVTVTTAATHQHPHVSLLEIFTLFLKVGLTGFGGGMAIVALVERMVVKEKQWVTPEEFLHGLAFGQILGPFSLNTCTFVGYRLRGVAGGVLAATAFLLPSFLIVSLLAWLYLRFQHLHLLQKALAGTNPVVIGLICAVVLDMSKKQIKGVSGWLLALIAFAAAALLKLNVALVLAASVIWALSVAMHKRSNG